MININMQFATVAEMQAELAALLASVPAPSKAPAAEPAPVMEMPKPPKQKASKPAATQPAAETAPVAPAVEEPASESPSEPAAPAPAAPSITLEEVRAKLAALSQSGKGPQVKGLIAAIGVERLTDVPADKYSELLEKAAAL